MVYSSISLHMPGRHDHLFDIFSNFGAYVRAVILTLEQLLLADQYENKTYVYTRHRELHFDVLGRTENITIHSADINTETRIFLLCSFFVSPEFSFSLKYKRIAELTDCQVISTSKSRN
jgi:hypothetical protein